MRGHVSDGTSVLMNNGDRLTISAGMRGWNILDQTGNTIAADIQAAADVEYIIANYGGCV